MRKLIILLILTTTFLCTYGQESVSPFSDTTSECYKVFKMRPMPLGYGFGDGYSNTPEKAKHMAYLNALESLNIRMLNDTTFIDSTLNVISDIPNPLVGDDKKEMVSRLNYATKITISNKIRTDVDEIKFISLKWLEFLDRYVTIGCDDVYTLDGVEYLSSCLVKLDIDKFDLQLFRTEYVNFLNAVINNDNLDLYESIKEWFMKDIEKTMEKKTIH